MTVDVIIPTLGAVKKTSHPFICFEKLHFLPWPIRLHIINRGKTWAEAINIGLKQTDGKNDVLIMDDDVFINGLTFSPMTQNIFENADIFGFKLLFPDGKVQHAGGIVRNKSIGHLGHGEDDIGQYDEPYYVCHVTTSLIYIKRHVIDLLKGMDENIPGVQMEDVDFSFRAIQSGFKILYVPGMAIHLESATKSMEKDFVGKIDLAFKRIVETHLNNKDLCEKLESFPRPFEGSFRKEGAIL